VALLRQSAAIPATSQFVHSEYRCPLGDGPRAVLGDALVDDASPSLAPFGDVPGSWALGGALCCQLAQSAAFAPSHSLCLISLANLLMAGLRALVDAVCQLATSHSVPQSLSVLEEAAGYALRGIGGFGPQDGRAAYLFPRMDLESAPWFQTKRGRVKSGLAVGFPLHCRQMHCSY